MIIGARRFQGLKTSLPTNKKLDLVVVKGPGVFVAGHVTKQGGSNDFAQVTLFIDGVGVAVTTYTGADNSGIDGVNNSGMKLVKGTVDCLSFSYNEPLFFEKECRVEVSTGSDAGIVQMIASLVIGKGCEYPS